MDVEQAPFLKQLVDSDPEVRDKAFDSLRRYLISGRSFTELELLKLWKGLYYSLYHTPLSTAAPLVTSLHSLQLSVPTALSLHFAHTFWLTIATLLPSLDANRLDKFLTLQRRMLHAQLLFLAQHGWREKESRDWIAMIGDAREGPLGVGGDGTKVGDGIRYHVLDVLLDEMERVDESETEGVPAWVTGEMKSLVQGQSEKASRGVRKRAEEVLGDERWRKLRGEGGGENGKEADDEEWSGFED